MRRLHLLRHAKSSWDDPDLPDHDRPLTARGRKAASRLAARLDRHGIAPDLVLCSTATRAAETLQRLEGALGGAPTLVEDGLYHASATGLLERLSSVPDDVDELLVVGHNPGLADLCLLLARPGVLRDRVAADFPTCALATLETDAGVSWAGLTHGGMQLVGLLLAREAGAQGTR